MEALDDEADRGVMEVRFVLLPRRGLDLFDDCEVAETVAESEFGGPFEGVLHHFGGRRLLVRPKSDGERVWAFSRIGIPVRENSLLLVARGAGC